MLKLRFPTSNHGCLSTILRGWNLKFLKIWKIPKTEAKNNYHLKNLACFPRVLAGILLLLAHKTAIPTGSDRPKPGRPLTPPGHLGVHGSKFGGDMAGSGCCHCNDHHFDRLFATLYGLRSVIFFCSDKKKGGGEDYSERWGFFVTVMRVGRWWWWLLLLFLNALRFQLVICIYVGGVFGMMFLRQYLPGKERFFLQVMGRLVVSVDLLMTMRSAFVHHTCKKKSLGGGLNYFLFSPLLGEMIQFD